MPEKSGAEDSEISAEASAPAPPNRRACGPLSGPRAGDVMIGSCGAPGAEDCLGTVADRETAARLARVPLRGASPAEGRGSGASRTRGEPGAETFTWETDADRKPKGGSPFFKWLAEGGARQKSAAGRGSTGSWRLAPVFLSARRRELLETYRGNMVRRDTCIAPGRELSWTHLLFRRPAVYGRAWTRLICWPTILPTIRPADTK